MFLCHVGGKTLTSQLLCEALKRTIAVCL